MPFAWRVPIKLQRERKRERAIPRRRLYHVTPRALKRRLTCPVEIQVITRHRRSRIPGLSAQQQIPTAPTHKPRSTQGAFPVVGATCRNSADHIYMTQTLQKKSKDFSQFCPLST